METPVRSWEGGTLVKSPSGPTFSNSTYVSGQGDGYRSAFSSPSGKQEIDVLFETPSDLLCPITQDILLDPVLNDAGQLYEVTLLFFWALSSVVGYLLLATITF